MTRELQKTTVQTNSIVEGIISHMTHLKDTQLFRFEVALALLRKPVKVLPNPRPQTKRGLVRSGPLCFSGENPIPSWAQGFLGVVNFQVLRTYTVRICFQEPEVFGDD